MTRPGIEPRECPWCDINQSDFQAPVILEPWGMWGTPSFPSLPDPLRPEMVAPDRGLSMGQIELLDI